MNEIGLKAQDASVAQLGLANVEMAYWNLHPSELVEETIVRGQGVLTDVGALAIDTGEFTGRSPKDKFV
ncbi:MAG: ATP-dependent phosphoenolpyruvate carboxykinase, partial [Bacteroidota bacterium]|nr:ATP-dependent phosphoenolpyruvate carboxykinase [Bacteroidota bacterium]